MATQMERIEENLVKLTMVVEPKAFEDGVNKSYLKNRSRINLPGFRKGRAPRKLLEAQFGREIFYDDAIDFVFPKIYEEAVKEHELEVVSQPTVDIEKVDESGAVLTAEVHTKPIVNISDFSNVEYVMPDHKVTDEQIDAQIEQDREKNARILSISDRPAENGDIVKIDFEGFLDGVPFAGGKGENFELVLGSKSFIEGFEEQIEGKNIGESFDVNVTFPEEYHQPDLSGKPVVFKVRLNEINKKELPDIDDDFAAEVSEFDTLEEYKNDIRQRMGKQLQEVIDREIEGQLIEGLSKRIEVNIPQPMLENETNTIIRSMAQDVQSRGIDFFQYMQFTGMDIDGLREMYSGQARANIEGMLAIEAVARAANIEINDQDFEEEMTRMCELYQIDKDKLLGALGIEEKGVRHGLRMRKAYELVKSQAKEIEKPAEDENQDAEQNNSEVE